MYRESALYNKASARSDRRNLMRGHVIGRIRESFYNEVRRKVNFAAINHLSNHKSKKLAHQV
jgi:hypothetical protein